MSPQAFADAFCALSSQPARAIIINCSTREVSTLALLAALRYANMPVCLIDCESTDGSAAWFAKLAQTHTFDLLAAPLHPHGKTLDRLFSLSRDAALFLIDSDLEIRCDDLVPTLAQSLGGEDTYGAGFVHPSEVFPAGTHTAHAPGRFMERMWIPCAWLKVAPIREALTSGGSFMHFREYREFPWSKTISKLLYARHRVPGLRDIAIEPFVKARLAKFGDPAPFHEYDTGAALHRQLQARGLTLAHLGEPYLSESLKHYHGVTRATLQDGQLNATAPHAIRDEVRARLRDVYGFDAEAFGTSLRAA
jgi:hypothetical protein